MGHSTRTTPRLSMTADRRREKVSDGEYSKDLLDSIENVLWRRYNDTVVHDFVVRHLDPAPDGAFLKTDLFEEAIGNNSFQRSISLAAVGMDLSPTIVKAAQRRCPGARLVQADVRRLPFTDGAFAGVISTSTLDHFRDPEDLELALRELARVVRAGGKLILTLDNPLNPILALRNVVPDAFRLRVGLTPYFVGYTCGPTRLEQLLREAGFDVRETTAVLHFPRVLAALFGSLLRRMNMGRFEAKVLPLLERAEILRRWPTRWRTGHYVAVLATKSCRA